MIHDKDPFFPPRVLACVTSVDVFHLLPLSPKQPLLSTPFTNLFPPLPPGKFSLRHRSTKPRLFSCSNILNGLSPGPSPFLFPNRDQKRFLTSTRCALFLDRRCWLGAYPLVHRQFFCAPVPDPARDTLSFFPFLHILVCCLDKCTSSFLRVRCETQKTDDSHVLSLSVPAETRPPKTLPHQRASLYTTSLDTS